MKCLKRELSDAYNFIYITKNFNYLRPCLKKSIHKKMFDKNMNVIRMNIGSGIKDEMCKR